jgi:hypothetical protein
VARGDDAGAMRFVEKGRDVIESRGSIWRGRFPATWLSSTMRSARCGRDAGRERLKFHAPAAQFSLRFSEERCQLLARCA